MKKLLPHIFLFFAFPALATDYYVSPTGNNSNPGTNWAAPWKTIAYAITGRSPGDTIHLTNGATFNENVYFGPGGGSGGTAGKPVTLTCDNPTSQATLYQANAASDGVSIYDAGYITLRNLVITGRGTTVNNNSNRKCGVNAYADNGQYAGLTFSNLTVTGFYRGIMLGGWNAATYGFNTVLIQSCQASNNLDCGGSTYGYNTPGAISNIVVSGCLFNNNPGDPAQANNTGSGFVLGQAEDGLIDHCVAHDNGGAGTNNAGPAGLWCYDSKGITIQFCESYHNRAQHQDGDGYDLDIGTHDSVIQYCYAHDNYGAGYLLCTDGSTTKWSNNIVRYCISERDGTGGHLGALHFYCPGGPAPLKDSQIYNNTIYSSVAPAVEFDSFGSMAGLALRNNVFITTTNTLISASASPTAAQALFQGNDYWSSGGTLKIQNGASTYYNSLSAWSMATGQEKIGSTNVGFNVNPQLDNAGGGGTVGNAYALTNLTADQLQPTSPLINAGLNLLTLFGLNPGPTDFYGTSIPQMGSYDVGAAEFQATPKITGGTMQPGGSFQLAFTYFQGQPFRVLGTNVLTAPPTNWPTLMNGTFGVSSSVTFTDTNVTATDNQRYYLIVSP